MKRHAVAIFLYAASLLLMVQYIVRELRIEGLMQLHERFFYVVGSCVLLYLGSWLLCLGKGTRMRHHTMRFTLLICFVWYLVLFLTLTLFDPLMGRQRTDLSWSIRSVMTYMKATANLEPLRSIHIYWNGYANHLITREQFLMNMVGNWIAAMPLALFLPMFFPKLRRWYTFLIACLLCIVGIELAQGILMCGYFDVDDILLNVGGAMMCYLLLKLPPIRKRLAIYTHQPYRERTRGS